MFRNNDVEIVRLSNSNLEKDVELATLRAALRDVVNSGSHNQARAIAKEALK